jgi:hypothetical protein
MSSRSYTASEVCRGGGQPLAEESDQPAALMKDAPTPTPDVLHSTTNGWSKLGT